MSQEIFLITTHSSRKTDLQYCSLTHLKNRYSDPRRLQSLPRFEELKPASSYEIYSGALSFYKIITQNAGADMEFLGSIKTTKMPQHAAFLNSTEIIVAFESAIEIWKLQDCFYMNKRIDVSSVTVVKRYEFGLLAGIHTVNPMDENSVVLSASSSDAIAILDTNSGKLTHSLRMPEHVYGKNYELDHTTSLIEHYIPNDLQTTHINSAFPFDKGKRIVISTLIQGAIGIFDLENSTYDEVLDGYVGCHGARVSHEGEIYFVDSCNGKLLFIDDVGTIKSEFSIDSKWLHDAIQVSERLFMLSLADRNALCLYNIESGDLICKKQFFTSWEYFSAITKRLPFWLGDSTKFLSTYSP